VNLSQVGAADWVHWGTGAVQESLRKKTTLPWIKDWTMIGRGQVKTYGDNPTRFTWTDGTQPAPPGGDAHGVFVEAASNGFEVLVPADTTARTVKVYVGVFRGQTRFEARLSDDSAPGWTDDSLLNKDGPSNALYTIHFRARSANQQLILRHTLLNTFNRLGNVTLQAAALMP